MHGDVTVLNAGTLPLGRFEGRTADQETTLKDIVTRSCRRRIRTGPRSLSGAGTLEVLVALSLLSIVLVGLVGLFMVSLSSGATSDASSIATNLARARLEQVRSLPRPAMIAENGTRSEQVMPWGQRRTFTIETSVDGSSPPFLDILVTVSWQTAYAASCRADHSAAPCRGTVVTQKRALETRVWDAEAP